MFLWVQFFEILPPLSSFQSRKGLECQSISFICSFWKVFCLLSAVSLNPESTKQPAVVGFRTLLSLQAGDESIFGFLHPLGGIGYAVLFLTSVESTHWLFNMLLIDFMTVVCYLKKKRKKPVWWILDHFIRLQKMPVMLRPGYRVQF